MALDKEAYDERTGRFDVDDLRWLGRIFLPNEARGSAATSR